MKPAFKAAHAAQAGVLLLGAGLFLVGLLRALPAFTQIAFQFDFDYYLRAAGAINKGQSPYQVTGYIYPPFFAAALRPLAWFPKATAHLAWFGVNCVSLYTALNAITRIAAFRRS